MSGIGLVLHEHAVAGDEAHAIDRLWAAQDDRCSRGSLDLVVGAGGRHRGKQQAGLTEDRRGGVEERPAAGLGARAHKDGEARGQLTSRVGIGGPCERATTG